MEEQFDNDIFSHMLAGKRFRPDDPRFREMQEIVAKTIELSVALNASGNVDLFRDRLSEITGAPIDKTTTIFPPLYTNFGRHIRIGRNVFINHACSFLDLGGITIEDDVLIGPRVNLVTENHPLDPSDRKALIPGRILIRKNAWIGAGATILPGITVGENSVVAAGSVVTKDVPDNAVVGGVPAKLIRSL